VKINLEGASTPSVQVGVNVNVASDIVYRKNLDFRQRGGMYAPLEVSFKTRTGTPVEILGVKDTGGLLETEILEKQGHRSALKARVTDPGTVPSNLRRHKLIVSTNHEDEPQVEISYRIAPPRKRR
jgi:hypothetical protein